MAKEIDEGIGEVDVVVYEPLIEVTQVRPATHALLVQYEHEGAIYRRYVPRETFATEMAIADLEACPLAAIPWGILVKHAAAPELQMAMYNRRLWTWQDLQKRPRTLQQILIQFEPDNEEARTELSNKIVRVASDSQRREEK